MHKWGKDNHAIMLTKHLKPTSQFSSYHIHLTMHQWINLNNELLSRRVVLIFIDGDITVYWFYGS